MAHTHKLTSEGLVELTAEEIAEANARDKAWEDNKSNRQIIKIRKIRNDFLRKRKISQKFDSFCNDCLL